MKIRVTFKTPDAVEDAVRSEVESEFPSHPGYGEVKGMDAEEYATNKESLRDKLLDAIGKFVRYGELLTVEFDTEALTATVIPARK